MTRDIYQDEIYESWLRNANEREVLEDVLRKRSSGWLLGPRMSVLDVGCGLGSAALRMFRVADEEGVKLDYCGLDPYENQLKKFREGIPARELELVCARFEDFDTDRRFDLGFVIHSLYYVSDLVASLEKLNGLTNKSIIVHHGERGINTVQLRFPQYVKEGPNIISTHDNVLRALDSLGIEYDYEIHESTTNIAPCKDSLNDDGRNMIRFFLDKPDLNDSEIREVSDYFNSMQGDKMSHDFAFIMTK